MDGDDEGAERDRDRDNDGEIPLLPANSSSPTVLEQQQQQGEQHGLDAQEDTAGTAAAAAPPLEIAYLQATDDDMGSAPSRALNGVHAIVANASPAVGADDQSNPPNGDEAAAITEKCKRRAQDDYFDDSPTGESARYIAGGAVSSQESMPSPSKKARRGGQDLTRTLSGLGQAAPDSLMLDGSFELNADVPDPSIVPDTVPSPLAQSRRRSTGTFSHVEIITAPSSATLASRTAAPPPATTSPTSASPVQMPHPVVEVEMPYLHPPAGNNSAEADPVDSARHPSAEMVGPSSQPLERGDANASSASGTRRRGVKGQRASLEPRRTSGRLSAQLERSTSSAPPTDADPALSIPVSTGFAARAPLSSTSSSNTEDGAVEVRSSPVAPRAPSSAAKGLSLFPAPAQPPHLKVSKTYSSKRSRRASAREAEAGVVSDGDNTADDGAGDEEADSTTVLTMLTGIEPRDLPFTETATDADADMADGASQSTLPEATLQPSKARKPPSSRRRRQLASVAEMQADQSHLDGMDDADRQAVEALLNENSRPSRGSRRAGHEQAIASTSAQPAILQSQKSGVVAGSRALVTGNGKGSAKGKGKGKGKAREEPREEEDTDLRDEREMAALEAERPLPRKRAPPARKGKGAVSADLRRTASETSTSTSASAAPALRRARSSLYRNPRTESTTSPGDMADENGRSNNGGGTDTDEAAESPKRYREDTPESESSPDEGDGSDASYGASMASQKRAAKGNAGEAKAANGASAEAGGARAKKAKNAKSGAGTHKAQSGPSPRPKATPKSGSKIRTTLPTPTSTKGKASANGKGKSKGKATRKTASAGAFRNHRGHARSSSHSSASPLPNLPAMPFSSQQSETPWNLGLLDDLVWVAVPALQKAAGGKEDRHSPEAVDSADQVKKGHEGADGMTEEGREAAPTFWWPGRIASRNRQNFRVTLMLDGGQHILQVSSQEITVAPEDLNEDHLLSYRNDMSNAPVFSKPKEAKAPFLNHLSLGEYCTPPDSAFVSVMLSASKQATSDSEDEDSVLPEMGDAAVSTPKTAEGKEATRATATGTGSARKRAGGSAAKASASPAKGKAGRLRKGQQYSPGSGDGSSMDVDTDESHKARKNGGGRKRTKGDTEGESEVDLEFQAQLESLNPTEPMTTESESEAEEADPSIKLGDVCLGKDPKSETWWPVRVLAIQPLATRVTHRRNRVLAKPLWEGPYTVEFYPDGEGLLGRKDLKQTDDPGFDTVTLGEVAQHGGGFKVTDAHVRKTFPQLARLICGEYPPGEKRQSLYFGDPRERHRQLPHEIHYGNFSDAEEGDVPKVQKCILRWLVPQPNRRKGAAAPSAGVEPPPLDAERIANMNGSEVADYVVQVLVPTALELLVIQHNPDISERARAQYAEDAAKQAGTSSTLKPDTTAGPEADADMAICVLEHQLAVQSLIDAKKGAWWNQVYNTRHMRKSHVTAQKKITFNANDRNGEDMSGRRRKIMNYKE